MNSSQLMGAVANPFSFSNPCSMSYSEDHSRFKTLHVEAIYERIKVKGREIVLAHSKGLLL